MQGFEFRAATRDDVAALHALAIDGLESRQSLEPFAQCIDEILRHGALQIYVGIVDGKIAGTFSIAIVPTHGARCAPLAIVEDVIVARDARGRGLGRAMMERAIEIAREAGCYKLMLSSNMKREDAHRFYDSLGFERHGISFAITI